MLFTLTLTSDYNHHDRHARRTAHSSREPLHLHIMHYRIPHSARSEWVLFRPHTVPISFFNAFAGEHYRSDHHRYNMKRRVAGLPPVSALVFNQKVLDRRAETAIIASPKGSSCEVCR